MAFWAVEVSPNKAYKVVPPFDLHLTQIVLPAAAKDKGRSVVEVKFDDKAFAIGSLKLDVTENISADIMFEAAKEISFSVSGSNPVHLVGYFIDHEHDHGDEFDSDEDMADLGFGGEDEEIDSDEDDLSDDGEESDEIDEDELSGATLQALMNQKRKADQAPANGAKKAKVDQKPQQQQQQKAEKKPQQQQPQQKAEQKPQQAQKAEQKPQTPKAEQKPQQPKAEQKPQTPQQKQQKEKGQTPQAQQQRPQTPEAKEGQTRTERGVKMETVTIGLGAVAQTGKKVSVMYTGRLENGKVFDSSQRPFKFTLGAGDVIQGWDIGVKGMRVGEKRKLTIPPALAYGQRGAPPDIPKNATLVFDVELVRV